MVLTNGNGSTDGATSHRESRPLALLAEGSLEIGHEGTGPNLHRHLSREMIDHPYRGAHDPGRLVGGSAVFPSGSPAPNRERPLGANDGGELVQDGIEDLECGVNHGVQPQTSSGTDRRAWMSAQEWPMGSTLPGLARQLGSNDVRKRF